VLNKYNVIIGVNIIGDTHGIESNFIVIDKKDKSHTLNRYSSYLYSTDL